MNKYDLSHRVSHHPKMSDEEWEDAYRAAWDSYYSHEHIRTILRRAAAHPRGRIKAAYSNILWFKIIHCFEGVHPLEGGAFRLKYRRDRRYGMPIESRFTFYPRYIAETLVKLWRYWQVYRECARAMNDALNAPDRLTYSDAATARTQEAEFESLDLYHATRGGEAALARKRRDDAIRAGAHSTPSIAGPTRGPADTLASANS